MEFTWDIEIPNFLLLQDRVMMQKIGFWRPKNTKKASSKNTNIIFGPPLLVGKVYREWSLNDQGMGWGVLFNHNTELPTGDFIWYVIKSLKEEEEERW